MSYENTYERAHEPERESDYQCPHCGDVTGGSVCGDCASLRTREWEGLEDSTLAILAIARESHAARWDNDTTQTRKKRRDELRKEFAALYRVATGEAL